MVKYFSVVTGSRMTERFVRGQRRAEDMRTHQKLAVIWSLLICPQVRRQESALLLRRRLSWRGRASTTVWGLQGEDLFLLVSKLHTWTFISHLVFLIDGDFDIRETLRNYNNNNSGNTESRPFESLYYGLGINSVEKLMLSMWKT